MFTFPGSRMGPLVDSLNGATENPAQKLPLNENLPALPRMFIISAHHTVSWGWQPALAAPPQHPCGRAALR
jgi:hypothetical protein